MCNLYTLRSPQRTILDLAFDFGRPRYKIAPGERAPVIRALNGDLEAVDLKWGYRPKWMSREWMREKKRQPPINVRSETMDTSPMFRSQFRHQRCLVPADGFYEPNDKVREKGGKEFWWFHREDDQPFAFAGIWTSYEGEEGEFENYGIITTEPEEIVSPVHRRMPAILRESDYATWLDPNVEDPDTLKPLLQPYVAEPLTGHIVSRDVYKMSPDNPDCVEEMG